MKCDHCDKALNADNKICANPPGPDLKGVVKEEDREYECYQYNKVGLCRECVKKNLPEHSDYTACHGHLTPLSFSPGTGDNKHVAVADIHDDSKNKKHDPEALKKKAEEHAHHASHNPRHDKKHPHGGDDDHSNNHHSQGHHNYR